MPVHPSKLSSKKHAFAAALFGLLTITTGVVATVLFYFFLEKFNDNSTSHRGPEFNFWWTPLPFVVPGILGIAAAAVRRKMFFAFYLAIAMVTLVVTGIFLIIILLFVTTLPNDYSPKDCTMKSEGCVCQRDLQDVFDQPTGYTDCDIMFEMVVYGHVGTGIYIAAWALCFAGSVLSCITCSYIERRRARNIVNYSSKHSPSFSVATVQPPGRRGNSGQDNIAYVYS